MLKNVQTLSLKQKLSPNLIQSQLLLAVPNLVLENEIKMQLENNPMLEEVTELEEEQILEDPSLSQTLESPAKEDEEKPEEKYGDEETYDIDDWYNYSEPDLSDTTSYEAEIDKADYEIVTPEKLRESPLEQLHRAGLEEKQIIIGEEILGSLDDDMYLKDNVDEIIADINKNYELEVTKEEFESVLKLIQKFDPTGVGSRNLQECLTVQIEELSLDDETKELAIKLINEDFEDFRLKKFERIAKKLNITLEKVNQIFELIQKLNPIPGNLNNVPEHNYVYPDFLVKNLDGELIVELNDDYVPNLKVSKKYISLLKQKNTPAKTKEFIKDKLDSAKWFINSIISRRETMMKVMKAIVTRQQDFFMSGDSLKPMFEKDIASDINMDISTVSRTVRNKYVQCDYGTYELKYFFSNPVPTESGEDVSSMIVKDIIKKLIEDEDKTKPLSDDKITKVINEQGYTLARRTIAKYREALKIPKASLRRQIKLTK